MVPFVCGNNYKDPNEDCDDGAKNSDQGRCRTDCVLNRCGNGRLDRDEECDDGNVDDGDGCSHDCKYEFCGDGIVNNGEACDYAQDSSTCNLDCTPSVCGDGKVNPRAVPPEQCDPGKIGVDTETCNSDCTVSRCGDHHQNMQDQEACDDGPDNGTGGSTCDVFCQLKGCGNGIVEPGEQCDPGTPGGDTKSCDFDCTRPVCGDHHVNKEALEVCDDGPDNGNLCDYGDPDCQRCNSTCTATVHPGGPFCGDAQVNGTEQRVEVCDMGPLNGTMCAYGDTACLSDAQSRCKADCSGFAAKLNGPYCGDGKVQPLFEDCDPGGNRLKPADAETCNSDCTFAVCGDGHVNTAALEACDDRNTSACGTCSADCKTTTLPTPATGTIIAAPAAGGNIADGDTFTLSDGITQLTFEFDSGDGVDDSHVVIQFTSTDDAATVAGNIIGAINRQQAVQITASCATADPCATVNLINGRATSLGNQTIVARGSLTRGFRFTGMSGGQARDCPAGVGCVTGDDCSSGVCTNGSCQSAEPAPMQSVLSEDSHQSRR